jgi:hypothetical protein
VPLSFWKHELTKFCELVEEKNNVDVSGVEIQQLEIMSAATTVKRFSAASSPSQRLQLGVCHPAPQYVRLHSGN